MNSENWPTCEICGLTRPVTNPHGQTMMKKYNGTMLCISHYSQAKWPDAYVEINSDVAELIE